MRRRVIGAQNVSRDCFVCGRSNAAGVHARFLDLEGDETVCLFTARDHHQGYPGRLHGGIAAALLDETIGRAITAIAPDTWYVTVELSTRYRKAVPLGVELRAVGRIVEQGGRVFSGTGELLLPDGTVAVEATGRYLRLPPDRIAGDLDETLWFPDDEPAPEGVDL